MFIYDTNRRFGTSSRAFMACHFLLGRYISCYLNVHYRRRLGLIQSIWFNCKNRWGPLCVCVGVLDNDHWSLSLLYKGYDLFICLQALNPDCKLGPSDLVRGCRGGYLSFQNKYSRTPLHSPSYITSGVAACGGLDVGWMCCSVTFSTGRRLDRRLLCRVIHLPPHRVCYCILRYSAGQMHSGEWQIKYERTHKHCTMQSWILEEFEGMAVCVDNNKHTLCADGRTDGEPFKYTEDGMDKKLLLHLWVGDLGGLLGQAAALHRDQVVVLGAHILVWVVEAAWTRPGGGPGQNKTFMNTGMLSGISYNLIISLDNYKMLH